MKKINQVKTPFYIYGAGIVACCIYTAYKYLYNMLPQGFLVSSRENNPKEIDGIAVNLFEEIDHKSNKFTYVIATPQPHHAAIIELLHKNGVENKYIFLIDNKQENSIMEEYYAQQADFLTAKQVLSSYQDDTTRNVDIQIYQARCHVDRDLNSPQKVSRYIHPIQVGASLTSQRIAALLDNDGENISEKNRNYCELTATYWAWKNKNIPYKGLCHYRRVFDLTDGQLQKLLGIDFTIDAVLPYPTVYYSGMEEEHLRYVEEKDWEAMLQALQEAAPDYYKAYKTIAKEPYFYNYNMLIAKQNIFDDYSSFLFSVLQETEKRLKIKATERADRFAGYLGENLTTIYFRANKDKYKIAHVGKVLLM